MSSSFDVVRSFDYLSALPTIACFFASTNVSRSILCCVCIACSQRRYLSARGGGAHRKNRRWKKRLLCRRGGKIHHIVFQSNITDLFWFLMPSLWSMLFLRTWKVLDIFFWTFTLTLRPHNPLWIFPRFFFNFSCLSSRMSQARLV